MPAVTIKPNEVHSVDINAAIESVAPQLAGSYGSIVLRYHSKGLRNLYAAVMAHDMGHPIAFHLDAINEIENYDQVSREGIWWLPRESIQDELILTNYGNSPLDLTLSLFDSAGKLTKQKVAIGPRQTSRYSVRQILKQTGLVGSYGGIKIEAAAHAGSLDTVHVLFDENGGFSASLKMFDRDPKAVMSERDFARTGTWTLRAPMLALTNPDPALAFPSGTVLQPQIFVHNTTEHKVNVTLQSNWRTENSTGKAFGPALLLQPYETRRIDIAALVDDKTIPKDAHWSAVVLKTNGLPDEVMAVAASYDETLRYGAQTPFSDQLSHRWEGGKWEVDRDHDSIITAGNGGTKPLKASFTIFYNHGQEKYELEQTLQPDDQMWIDIGDLIRRQVPDENRKILPANLTEGSYQFNDLTNIGTGNLFEGKVIYDLRFGHVAYGCASCCGAGEPPWVAPNPLGVPLSFTNGLDVDTADGCYGDVYSVITDFTSWSSANTSVATITSTTAQVTGISVGSAVQSSPGYISWGGADVKHCTNRYFTPSGPANVAACQTPTGETTQAVRQTLQGPSAPTSTDFIQTLAVNPPQTAWMDNGAATDESEGSSGSDSCWFSGSPYLPFTSVSGGHWIVGGITPGFAESQVVTPGAGQWGPGEVGWLPGPVRYYQQNRPKLGLPVTCSATLYQNVSLTCTRATPVDFVYNSPITTTIDSTGLTNCREGVCTAHIPYQ